MSESRRLQSSELEVTRRGLLRAALGTGVIAALGLIGEETPRAYKSQLRQLQELTAPYRTGERVPRPLPQLHQVAIAGNSRLRQMAPFKHNEAYVVVHPNYMLSEAAAWQREVGQEHGRPNPSIVHSVEATIDYFQGAYGDFGAYRRRLSGLFNILGRTGRPVIIFSEANDLYKGDTRDPDLLPPENAIVVATKTADSDPMPTVRYTHGGETVEAPQDLTTVWNWLAMNGVKKLLWAGEKGVHGNDAVLACVGFAIRDVHLQGYPFKSHALDGLVFPTHPSVVAEQYSYSDGISTAINAAQVALNNPVPIPE